jgi:hypothetical protein
MALVGHSLWTQIQLAVIVDMNMAFPHNRAYSWTGRQIGMM